MTKTSLCQGSQHSVLLEKFFDKLKTGAAKAPVLDLACGTGRNGLFLDSRGIEVVFADRNDEALQQVAEHKGDSSRIWPLDLEVADMQPLANQQFSAVLVFRYLHRPLFEAIKQAVIPGGMIIYETFTEQQAQLGRPKNPNFLLKSKELESVFEHWQILHSFEGIENGAAIASIVAINPAQ